MRTSRWRRKIFETPPEVKGDIVECGTWKGSSAANLSLVCRITGHKLKIYDSFQGLPESEPADRQGVFYNEGEYLDTLDKVKSNISRYGAIECCEFIKGWFNETLPRLDTPVLLASLDVDLEASLETCVRHLWPNLTDKATYSLMNTSTWITVRSSGRRNTGGPTSSARRPGWSVRVSDW